MSQWKKVKIDFETVKLGDYIEPIKTTVGDLKIDNPVVYGVTNKEGIVQTGKPASEDVSKYIVLQENCFAFNPYRINVGSIGINEENLKGCVSPAYVVFKTKNGLLPKFLFFYLKSDYGIHLINWYGNRGGVRNALRYSDLCNIDIPDTRKLNQQALLDKFSFAAERIDELSKEIEKQKSYAKKLRANILQDAIEGKLTADWREKHPIKKGNPDFDAEALFEKIQIEKQEKSKKQKPIPVITEDEKPFAIPSGWKWTRLGDVTTLITDGKHGDSVNQNDSGFYFLSAKDIQNEKLIYDSARQITESDFYETHRRTNLEPGDICVVNTGATVGKLAIAPNDPKTYRTTFQKSVAVVKLVKDYVNNEYIKFFLLNDVPRLMGKSWGSAINNLLLSDMRMELVALPPLAEQKEIVARVKKHLETITQLETQIATRETLTKQLMQGLLKDAFEER